MSSRQDVLNNNTNSFPNNNSGQITPAVLRDFNADFINSVVFIGDPTVSASYAASASVASTATSASFASNAANASSASYALTASYALFAANGGGGGGTVDTGSLLVTASAVFSTITFTKGDGSTFDITVAQSGSVATASYALFAVSASQAANAVTASYVATASYAQNANLLDGLNSTAFVLNSQTSSMSVLSASFATSASNAAAITLVTDNGNNNHKVLFTNGTTDSTGNQVLIDPGTNFTYNPNADRLTVTNLSVPGTASFGYVQTVTGSAVIIGQEFIILNANPPTARYAGIKVYDTGSATTASFQWDGNNDNWIIVEETGQSAGILTGPTGSLGSEVFPTTNTILKGTGHHTVGNSNITDNGSLVSINSTLYSSGSVGIGTSVPLDVLHVAKNASNTNIGVSIQNLDSLSPSHVRFLDYQGTVKAAITLVQQEPSLRFLVNGQDRLIIDDTGNIGVGVNPQNAQYLLDVNGIIRSTTGVIVTGSLDVSGSINGNLNGTASFATSASWAPSTPAFPFTGSAEITGSLTVNSVLSLTGSTASPTRLNLRTFGTTTIPIDQYVTESGLSNVIFGSNIIMGNTALSSTASFQLSGSQNYVNVSALGSNANFIAGRRFGFAGRQSFVFVTPNVVSASNMAMPAVNQSWLAGATTITNNSNTTPSFQNSFIHSSVNATLTSGSFSISNTYSQASLALTNTWVSSSLSYASALVLGAHTVNTFTTASDDAKNIYAAQNSIVAGTNITTHIKSGTANGGGVVSSIIVSNNFTVSGSAGSTGSAAIFGSWPVQDGRLNDLDQVRFVVGTGTGTSARRTSLFVSSSGLTVVQNGLLVTGSVAATSFTGSLLGTASYATQALSASYADSATTASYALTSTSASYANFAMSASVATNATSASIADNAVTASYVQLAQSASFAVTASYALNAGAGGVQASDIYSYTFLLMGA